MSTIPGAEHHVGPVPVVDDEPALRTLVSALLAEARVPCCTAPTEKWH